MMRSHLWRGENITQISGRVRAIRIFPDAKPCKNHPEKRGERHHKNGDTRDNSPDNIEWLCRKCHMEADGRLEKLRNSAPGRSAKALKVRLQKLGY